ncbi:Rid family hydrolase [Thermomonospora umbrina]|uniref:Endoribonuclease L-PSP n=1 Tax=Thermomonospora umbrina TaxID=111806 RepID=A0A3D9STQ8_9ACTN|nr:Rid family hydrolase [Thermomonospora umbrina]REE99349.1 endoribonuclease L-PSP [Thermomonospora umbrina]
MRRKVITGAVSAAVLVGLGGAASAAPERTPRPPKPTEVRPALPEGQSNPSIAGGVGVGSLVTTYTSSGLGPAGANTSAPAGTPERYVDFPGGVLPPGVTLTEAQSINALKQIGENLKAAGLTPRDVISMRAYLSNPPGSDVADFAGWNRAYRQFYANTDLVTRKVLDVPLGTAAPAPPMYANPARPARVTLEIENLPVQGWLVEVEVVAAYRHR